MPTNSCIMAIAVDNNARDPITNTKTIEIRKTSLVSLELLDDKNHAQVTSNISNDTHDTCNDKFARGRHQ